MLSPRDKNWTSAVSFSKSQVRTSAHFRPNHGKLWLRKSSRASLSKPAHLTETWQQPGWQQWVSLTYRARTHIHTRAQSMPGASAPCPPPHQRFWRTQWPSVHGIRYLVSETHIYRRHVNSLVRPSLLLVQHSSGLERGTELGQSSTFKEKETRLAPLRKDGVPQLFWI